MDVFYASFGESGHDGWLTCVSAERKTKAFPKQITTLLTDDDGDCLLTLNSENRLRRSFRTEIWPGGFHIQQILASNQAINKTSTQWPYFISYGLRFEPKELMVQYRYLLLPIVAFCFWLNTFPVVRTRVLELY